MLIATKRPVDMVIPEHPLKALKQDLLLGIPLVRSISQRCTVTLREADRASTTVLWSEVNSNCRYRFLNCQTAASC
jgi:hypothetical protein